MNSASWFRYSAPDIEPRPMSAALPSPAMTMMFGYGPGCLPLRIIASYPAAMPEVNDPPLAIGVCAHGTVYGVHRYVELATYMQPVGPASTLSLPAAFSTHRYWIAGPHPAQVLWPAAYGSSSGKSGR